MNTNENNQVAMEHRDRLWLRVAWFVAGLFVGGGGLYILQMSRVIRDLKRMGIMLLACVFIAATVRSQDAKPVPFKLLSTVSVTNNFCFIEGLLVVGICLGVSAGVGYCYIKLHHAAQNIGSNRQAQIDAAISWATDAPGATRTVPAQAMVGKVTSGPWAATVEWTTNFADWFPLASYAGDGRDEDISDRVAVPPWSGIGFRVR